MAEDTLTVGTTVEYGSSPTKVKHVTALDGPSEEAEMINTTDYDDTDGYQRFTMGMIDPGEVEVTAKFDSSEYSSIRNEIGTSQDWIIRFHEPNYTTNSDLTFTGILYSVAFAYGDSESDGLVELTLTIKVSGKPTFTQGS